MKKKEFQESKQILRLLYHAYNVINLEIAHIQNTMTRLFLFASELLVYIV